MRDVAAETVEIADPTAPEIEALVSRPAALISVPVTMSWGREDWHGSTQEGVGEARVVVGGGSTVSVRALLGARPELAGRWTRALFGDGQLPVFTKFLRTRFAPFVHFGFAAPVERDGLLRLLRTEQALMRRLLDALSIGTAAEARKFMDAYSDWAMRQSLGAPEGGGRVERWGSVALDDTLGAAVAPFLRGGVTGTELGALLSEIRLNRAHYCASVNLVDLRGEVGNMLLSPAGVPHAINGLSEQTHPADAAATALRALFVRLEELERRHAPPAEIAAAVDAAGLAEARRRNVRPPKSEAWLPMMVNGTLVLVEPQQTSNVTYSFADFTTPFVWHEGRGAFGFRKGDPAAGLSDAELATFVDAIDLTPLDPARARRAPVPVDGSAGKIEGARLYRLVDEPWSWPFFTAYLVELEAGATFEGVRPEGTFVNVLALRGTAELGHARLDRALALSPDAGAAAIVWATAEAPYTISARGPAALLLTSIPTPARTTPGGGPAPTRPVPVGT